MAARIHLFGAAGSGTTTLGAELAGRLDVLHLDADRFYWKHTDPPFTHKHPPARRVAAIRREIEGHDSWILSGSIVSWGGPLVAMFTAAVFLYLDPEVRLARLVRRERERYGTRIDPGGSMHRAHREFVAWAASYETAAAPVRSLALHENWIRGLACPLLRLDSAAPVAQLADEVLESAVVGRSIGRAGRLS